VGQLSLLSVVSLLVAVHVPSGTALVVAVAWRGSRRRPVRLG
jgi:hypothetical protein